MTFEDYKEKCPLRTNTLSGILVCAANDKSCTKEHCAFYYWVMKLIEEWNEGHKEDE